MARPADTAVRHGDLVWSPNGENEWCTLISFTSVTTWTYVRPSTGALLTGPKSLLLYLPDYHRPASSADFPPKPTGAN